MRIVLTGAGGFLGWHTRVRLAALTDHEVVSLNRDNWSDLAAEVRSADAIIHIAGVNRGERSEVERGNVALSEAVADAIARAGRPVPVVYANSIQAGNDTPYGAGKAAAGAVLAQAAAGAGSNFTDVVLPNLFGEHGAPRYNSFVATFVDAVASGVVPQINDREVELLHAQGAAQHLMDGLSGRGGAVRPRGSMATVQGVYDQLRRFHDVYNGGDMPDLSVAFSVDLFNTYRAALFPGHYPLALNAHSDDRGRLVETVRSHGGQGQTFVSTTKAGVTRGEHYHLNKVERFVVLRGQARISLRRMFTEEVVSFDVSGESPSVVDMPTMWVHNITNTGNTELTTLFWTHSLFDPENPDTYWEPVSLAEKVAP
ncbi:UDP-2-acetamido-2,6-beta-L-arabino-hexul-4-ose reductase [Pedococcus cremeus]|uniref:UDP-2-acetamido-2,6-beta-L-arabino-hexul-4-ose reductase n=1 Tax=Pedococcus cremeus TaxID=587636 RepID=A0A1H9RKG3_9MICO|nr:NAD-dependent epimerase/dehydratase family protein [Pedococcus cremeus]SER73256.1 UDP-2-acetamido-2,6-beta-L-arabino-hexul-4-ose reductase [Pedococcus cremeus]